MRRYSTLPVRAATREVIETFKGYNHNLRIGDGEFYNMQNMTSDYYPVLSPRKGRGVEASPAEAGGLIAKDKLCYVDGSEFVVGSERVDMGLSVTNPKTQKQLISMGAYVIIMPDKKYINTQALYDYGDIEASFTASLGVTFELCTINGDSYGDTTVSDTAPQSPENLDLWIDTSTEPYTLKRYAKSSGMWVSIASSYIKMSAQGIGTSFRQYDGVTISGIQSPELQDLNGSVIIWECSDDYIVVAGILDQVITQEEGEKPITITRTMPEMDYVIEAGNRLWGCKYGIASNGEFVNEIYASKLGDFRNWNCYMSLSTDSYTASCGTDGSFTGAISYLGNPLFFKENCIHKVYGNYPANFQIQTTECRGVEMGSASSLAIVNETLFYKARGAVCAYDGSLPVEVSQALGNERYTHAVAGSIDSKYYISMQGDDGWNLFVYDVAKGLWHREDRFHALAICSWQSWLYAIDYDSGEIVILNGCAEPEEKKVRWMAQTGLVGTDMPGMKYISRLTIRMSLELGTQVWILTEYDSSGNWEPLGTVTGTNLRSFSIPVRPRRCDHLRLRIEGQGEAKIYAITKTIEQGSEIS